MAGDGMDIKTLCLGMLTSGEATGYDLKKRFEGTFSHFYTAGYGSIYPALADLAESGMVTCTEVAEQGKPAKKIYRITDMGTQSFKKSLGENDCPCHKVKSEFLAMMYFAQFMNPGQVSGLLQHRLQHIESTLDMLKTITPETSNEQTGPAFVRGFGETILKAAHDYISAYKIEQGSTSDHQLPGTRQDASGQ
jgi:PadR family transcriptional regulator AphA